MKTNLLLSIALAPFFFMGNINITATSDANITDSTEITNSLETIENDVCSKWVFRYKKPNGSKYKICSDSSGFRVTDSGGNKHNYGGGYTLREVEKKYGLKDDYMYSQKNYPHNCKCA